MVGEEQGLGLSQVSLKKSVIEVIREFFPTEAEWAARNQEQIIVNASASASNVPLYTVPDNKTLFITSINLAARNDHATIANAASIGKDPIDLISVTLRPDSVATASLSFPMPLKYNAGNVITLFASAVNIVASAQLQGWLENIFITN